MMPADYLRQVFPSIAGRQGCLPGTRMPAPLLFQCRIRGIFKPWWHIAYRAIKEFLKSRGDLADIMVGGSASATCGKKNFAQRLRAQVYQKLCYFTDYVGMLQHISTWEHDALWGSERFGQTALQG